MKQPRRAPNSATPPAAEVSERDAHKLSPRELDPRGRGDRTDEVDCLLPDDPDPTE